MWLVWLYYTERHVPYHLLIINIVFLFSGLVKTYSILVEIVMSSSIDLQVIFTGRSGVNTEKKKKLSHFMKLCVALR